MVKFTTITCNTTVEGSRTTTGNPRPIHAAATAMTVGFVVSPIIRGYTLQCAATSLRLFSRLSRTPKAASALLSNRSLSGSG
jgi:hypothetical protein